jgi:hypothetical protein
MRIFIYIPWTKSGILTLFTYTRTGLFANKVFSFYGLSYSMTWHLSGRLWGDRGDLQAWQGPLQSLQRGLRCHDRYAITHICYYVSVICYILLCYFNPLSLCVYHVNPLIPMLLYYPYVTMIGETDEILRIGIIGRAWSRQLLGECLLMLISYSITVF